MKADLTRNTFQPLKHFTRVLMQQGRVQLDADWNEQISILLRQIRRLAADVIGDHGGPSDNLGFRIEPLPASKPGVVDFRISYGDYYVNGILCQVETTAVPVTPVSGSNSQMLVGAWNPDGVEFAVGQWVNFFDSALGSGGAEMSITQVNSAKRILTFSGDLSSQFNSYGAPAVRRVVTYQSQPDLRPAQQVIAGRYQVYLDVWERLITNAEDDSIREVALGGPDTSARSHLVWQVKLMKHDTGGCLLMSDLANVFQPPNSGMLKARAQQAVQSTDPCIIPPQASYRGPENQLYRVEIHTGSFNADGTKATPTFKWSRENGAVVFPIVGGGGSNVVTLASLGRDDRFGLAEGDWVEVEDDDYILQMRASNLMQVQTIDRVTMKVTLVGTPDPAVGKDLSRHPLLRRWDQKAGDPAEGGLKLASDNAAQIVEQDGDNWLELEDGVQIQFQKPGAHPATYRTGDYWLIPARTATGDVEWPNDTVTNTTGNVTHSPIARGPDGVTHQYAPLAIIDVTSEGAIKPEGPPCLKQYKRLAT